jgi:ABC-type multidrug transport system ATPase subunit
MIEISGVTKHYGRLQVLRDLTLAVAPGESALLVGPNGCGKSTTLRLLSGLSTPDAGRLRIAGADVVRERAAALGALSFLPQSPRFNERLTVAEILAFYARLRGVPAERVATVIRRWGLADCAAVITSRLSGGTRQRLALAVFDLPDAPVLVLDEPGLSLDPEWRRHLQAHLQERASAGRTILVATHLLDEWTGQATRCFLLDRGQGSREVSPAHLRGLLPAWPSPALAGAGADYRSLS